ncbi:hypothetical protein [Bacillus altitudinis]|uniref:Uncharacterized protein n=1 Tax=Bacillus aerius TaxID=293388 RepID=A0ABR6B5A0_9BACI|nr:hypothetical protein [Bacillus altitudinis]MBA8919285.1 hypothetical protein [Bacillus aerius]
MSGHIIRIGMLSCWVTVLGICVYIFKSHYPDFMTGIQVFVESITEGMY